MNIKDLDSYLSAHRLKVMSVEMYEDLVEDSLRVRRYEKAGWIDRLIYFITGKM